MSALLADPIMRAMAIAWFGPLWFPRSDAARMRASLQWLSVRRIAP